ncbi:MAG: hypothetical protein AAF368_12230, partial [Planctomycetota bacterium]
SGLATLAKVNSVSECRGIFDEMQRACQTNQDLTKSAQASRTVRLALDWADRILAGRVSLDELFLIDRFGIAGVLSRGIGLRSRGASRPGVEADALKHEFEDHFHQLRKTMRAKTDRLRDNLRVIRAIRAQTCLDGLLDADELGRLEQEATAKFGEAVDEVAPSPVLGGLRVSLLDSCASRLWLGCLRLLCFKRGFFDVFRKGQSIARPTVELLFGYCSAQRPLAEFEAFLSSDFEETSRLPVAGLDEFLAHAQRVFSRISEVYSSEDWLAAARSPGVAGVHENLLLFEYLTSEASAQRVPPAERPLANLEPVIRSLSTLARVRKELAGFPVCLARAVNDALTGLDQFVASLSYRTTHRLARHVELEQALLGRVANLRRLASNAVLAELFAEELRQELAALGRDPFRQNWQCPGVDLAQLDMRSFFRLTADPPSQRLLGVFVEKTRQSLRQQKSMKQSIGEVQQQKSQLAQVRADAHAE